MGRTLLEWTDQVGQILIDAAGVDSDDPQRFAIGVKPALSQYSIDEPNVVAVDLTPSDRWLPLPAAGDGWVNGWSRIVSLAWPADSDPPDYLEPSQWRFARDPSDAALRRILLPYDPGSDQVRVEFTSTWPTPTSDPEIDLLPSVAFDAVTSLAASMVLNALATEAARHRGGALATDFVDGTDRSRDLLEAARSLRILYNTFIGLGAGAGIGGAGAAGGGDRVLRSTRITSR
jgi:hypothetical protein